MEISELYEIFKQHPVVTTDSRDCPVGSLFFALKGASFNGNKFAAAALEKGCAYAVVDEAEYVVEGDARFILVDNCLHTLQQLARYHRRALGTPIIGITGTNGKTTTKELTAAVLLQKYNVLYTEGNFNNDIGVPKTLLRLNSTHDIAVVEMGASHPGDIKTLVEIVEPDYALITNVGRAHLQGFGSFEGVIKTKGELYDFVRAAANGENDAYAIREVKRPLCVFIDNDNQYLNGIADGLNLVRYGLNVADKKLYVAASDVKSEPMLSFSWAAEGKAQHHVDSHLIGAYNITNMLAAIAAGIKANEQVDLDVKLLSETLYRTELVNLSSALRSPFFIFCASSTSSSVEMSSSRPISTKYLSNAALWRLVILLLIFSCRIVLLLHVGKCSRGAFATWHNKCLQRMCRCRLQPCFLYYSSAGFKC